MLTRRLFFVACALASLAPASAQTAPAPIPRVRARYDRIEQNLLRLRRVPMTSAEGSDAEAVAFFDGARLRKVLARGLYAGAPSQHYYFWDDRLFFVLDSRSPRSALDKSARQNRFYFDQGKLIRWIDASGNRVPVGDTGFVQYEKEFRRTGDYWRRMTRGRDFRRLEVSRGIVTVWVP